MLAAPRHLLAAALSLSLAIAVPVLAVDHVVTRHDDPVPDGCLAADCSLREAVISANTFAGNHRILLSAGTYLLTLAGSNENNAATGDLDVKSSTEILGVGAGITFLNSDGMGDATLTFSQSGSTFALRGVTILNSDAGGLLLGAGTHTVEDCEIRNNGTGSAGGGIFVAIGANVTLRRVTVTGSAESGLTVSQGVVAIENSTFAGNGTSELQATNGGTLTCTHCTVSDPGDADQSLVFFNSDPTFVNSIVAGTCFFDANSSLTSLGGNVESPGTGCGFDQGSDQEGVAAATLDLGALDDNGGATRTMLPGAGSPVVGGGLEALCLVADQRAAARAATCDSGAVERAALVPPKLLFADGFQQGSPSAWVVQN